MFQKTCIILMSLIVAAVVVQSCRNRGIIPADTMSDIYYDIYLTDQAVRGNVLFRRMTDTLLIYEPIFQKYGYTTEDYNRSIDIYLLKPEKLQDILEETKLKLDRRESQLKQILEAEGKRSGRWTILDSLEIFTAEGISSNRLYKNLRIMFFKPDSLVMESPVPDSAFIARPQNPYMLFSDSAMYADSLFSFYTTPGMMEEIRLRDEARMKENETEPVLKTDKPETTDLKEMVPVPPKGRRKQPMFRGSSQSGRPGRTIRTTNGK